MKNYIRHQNISFKLRNIRDLAANWLAACDKFTSTEFSSKQKRAEAIFKAADHYVESLETTLLDTDDDDDDDHDDESDLHLDENDSSNTSDDE